MKVRLTILTQNQKPIPDVDIQKLEQQVKDVWQMIIDGFLLFDSEKESATVESVEIVREDGDGDG